jgi:arylsulfatase A-like enzyme
MSLSVKLLTILVLSWLSSNLFAAGKATHVVVIVWDGMRPDFVSEATTPTLSRLARQGVTFRNHHPVYLSTTEVNGTALATGVYPGQSGIIANKEFRPAIDASNKIKTESLAAVRKGDELTGGHYLAFPTLAETLHSHGLRTAIAGAKGVALLHDRSPRGANTLGVNLFAGKILPEGYAERIKRALGEFPSEHDTTTNWDHWTAQALVGPLWEDQVPAFSLLWLSEPDQSQHGTGPGSPTSLAAIRHSDDMLARVLTELDQKGLGKKTDIIVVSDHGFSTIGQNADVSATLNEHGFNAYRAVPEAGMREGDVMVVGNGGSVFLYVIGHKASAVESVVHCLQAEPFCGVVFTQTTVEGAFRLRDVRLNSSAAPDIVLSLRWKPDKSTNGTPGLICSDYGQYGPGQGMHGSLSPFDMHNTCVAAGPDFRQGLLDDVPSGNIDIAPTILWILGIKPKQRLSGRVLKEALTQTNHTPPSPKAHLLEASYSGGGFTWHQHLMYSEVNGVLYFDQGNGEQVSPKPIGGN